MQIVSYSLNYQNFINEFLSIISDLLGSPFYSDASYYVAPFLPVPGYYLVIARPGVSNTAGWDIYFCTDWNSSTKTPVNRSPKPQTIMAYTITHAFFFRGNNIFGALGYRLETNYEHNKRLTIFWKDNDNNWYAIDSSTDISTGVPAMFQVKPSYPTISINTIYSQSEIISPNNKYLYSPVYITSNSNIQCVSNKLIAFTRVSDYLEYPIITSNQILYPGKGIYDNLSLPWLQFLE